RRNGDRLDEMDALVTVAGADDLLELEVRQAAQEYEEPRSAQRDRERRAPQQAIGHQPGAGGARQQARGRRPMGLQHVELLARPFAPALQPGDVAGILMDL